MQLGIEQPQFLLEPTSTYVLENQPIELQCQAIRARQIFFNCDQKWIHEQEHRKSTEINEKDQLVIITTVELKPNQEYKCFCQAWSATGGTLKSRLAHIQIAYLEKIFEWEPLRTDSVVGKSTELRCRPPMGNPYPKVTWLKDNHTVPINRNGRFILSNENSLIIAYVEKNDAGNYTCLVSNLAGNYSSEPAELIVHDDRGWSDWQEYSECKGIPCNQGRQRRQRTCLNPPTVTNRPSCDGEQFQERECSMPCQKEQIERYSNWTEWSNCQSSNCTSIRTRQCLQEPCFDQLSESRVCSNDLCSTTINPLKMIYSSIAFGSFLIILLFILLWMIRSFRQRRKKTQSTEHCHQCYTEKNDYPFYYSIQQDSTSTRSFISQNHSDQSLIHSSSPTFQFNHLYKKILQNLPKNIDLRYFSISIVNQSGCRLEIPHTGISLTIPEDAILVDHDHLIYILVLHHDDQMPRLNNNQTRLSPVILIGPPEITLLKPVVLSFEHTADIDSAWKFQMMFTEDFQEWKSILTYSEETISTPVYLQFHHERRAFLLLENLGAYTLIGQPIDNERESLKYLQMACFINYPTLRIRLFDQTSDAFERCLSEESTLNHYLCDQPQTIVISNHSNTLCLNIDYELSPTSRMHLGYKEISFIDFWTNSLHQSSFVFTLPQLQINPSIIHGDLYQPNALDHALHTRISIDRSRITLNTIYLPHRQRTKLSKDSSFRLLPSVRQKLCQILDPPNVLGNDWRMLASHLLGVNYLQYFATKTSPTEHLLTFWYARQESLVHLINVLNQIGRSDAACLIVTQMNLNY